MKFLFNLFGVAVVINGFLGGFCVLIAFLNRERGDYTLFLIYGIPSMLAAVALYASASKIEKKIQEAEKKSGPSTLQPKHRVLIAAGAALLVYLTFKPEEPRLWTPVEVAQPVDVSSYRRSDGTYVSDHKRAEPGARAFAVDTNQDRIAVWRARARDYKKERNQLWVICASIVGAGFVWAGRAHKTA